MASVAVGIPADKATSPDRSHTIMVRNYQRDDLRLLFLNDATEVALSKILRSGFDVDHVSVTGKPASADVLRNQVLAWAKHISGEIPGYSNWQEIYDFTFNALHTPDAVPGIDTTYIGTEADLVAELHNSAWEHDYALQDREAEKALFANHALSLRKARDRQAILKRIPAYFSAANPIPTPLALLVHKILYTYRLRECLLGQVGYCSGSLELAAHMDNEFEFHMYLIQMKLQRPDRLHIFKAPKPMAHYTTDPASPLPWNNQFSYSRLYDEVEPQQMPIFVINYIERKIVQVLRLDVDSKKWGMLCALLGWEPHDPTCIGELCRIKTEFVSAEVAAGAGLAGVAGHFLGGNLTLAECGFHVLTLPHILTIMSNDEIKRKAFYALFLELTWSDAPLRKEENPFAEEHERRIERSLDPGVPIKFDLAHLKDTDVKDPRLPVNQPALLSLSLARYYPWLAGHKSNFILTPETAGPIYRHKLQNMNEAELDQLFSNIAAYPRTASPAAKVDAAVNQAVKAARGWQTSVIKNHRPVYAGPSDQMLSYSRIFLSSIDPGGCKKGDHPNVEQLRLTLLAALIGSNQHHTYDECMIASHGLSYGDVTLEYKDRTGYRDITKSADPFIRDMVGKPLISVMISIGKQVIANFEENEALLDPPLPSWRPLVAQWFKDTTGHDFPVV